MPVNHRFKAIHCFRDNSTEFPEQEIPVRNVWKEFGLANLYLASQLRFYFGVRVFSPIAQEFRSFFESGPPRLRDYEIGRENDVGTNHTEVEFLYVHAIPNREQEPVFLGEVQVVEDVKRVPSVLTTKLIGLQSFNLSGDVIREPTLFVLLSGGPLRSFFVNGETDTPVGFYPTTICRVADEMIQGGPQLMGGLPSKNGDYGRKVNNRVGSREENVLACLRIYVIHNAVVMTSKVVSGLSIHVEDVFISSVDLRSNIS